MTGKRDTSKGIPLSCLCSYFVPTMQRYKFFLTYANVLMFFNKFNHSFTGDAEL